MHAQKGLTFISPSALVKIQKRFPSFPSPCDRIKNAFFYIHDFLQTSLLPKISSPTHIYNRERLKVVVLAPVELGPRSRKFQRGQSIFSIFGQNHEEDEAKTSERRRCSIFGPRSSLPNCCYHGICPFCIGGSCKNRKMNYTKAIWLFQDTWRREMSLFMWVIN